MEAMDIVDDTVRTLTGAPSIVHIDPNAVGRCKKEKI